MRNKIVAVLLSAGLAAGQAASALAGGMSGGGGSPSGVQVRPFPRAVDLSGTLGALKTLTPSQQLDKLEELARTDAAARNVAAVVLRPELIGLRRAELEQQLGPEQLAEVSALAIGLHVEARSDERVLGELESAAGRLAPEGRAELLDLGRWFDGSAKPAAAAAPAVLGSHLAQALVWPIGDPRDYERRVHTLTADNDRILIDGKVAQRLKDGEVKDGVTKETLLHPNDPNLLVRLYHSPGSLAGFERKNAKVESLGPLSQAGAAPRLIEHGEAPIDGKGRVYFYVQELAKGLTLQELRPEERPLDQIGELFGRLARAGVALLVPGPSQAWLLSNIMLGETTSGGSGAYVLDGSVEDGKPEDLVSHYQMLLSVLYPGPAPKIGLEDKAPAAPAQPRETTPAYAPRAPEKLATLEAAADLKTVAILAASREALDLIATRHALPAPAQASGSESRFVFPSEQAAADAAVTLLGDPDVAQVKIHPAIKGYLEKRGVKPLAALLKLMPAGEPRDQLILKIPGSAYAKSQSADVAAVLSLINPGPTTLDRYRRIPAGAWRRLGKGDMERLVKQWTLVSGKATAGTVLAKWLAAHQGEIGAPALPGPELRRLIELAPTSDALDQAIADIPATAYSRLNGGDAAGILWMITGLGEIKAPAVYARVPVEAWLRLGRENVDWLIKKWIQWDEGKHRAVAATVLRFWLGAHAAELGQSMTAKELLELRGQLEASEDLDSSLVSLPKEAWRKLQASQMEQLIKGWAWAKAPSAPITLLGLWLDAHQEELGEPAASAEAIRTLLALIPESEQRDGLVLKIPAAAYAKMSGPDIANLIWRISDPGAAGAYPRIPAQAWERLTRHNAEWLAKQWLGREKYETTAGTVIKLWAGAQRASTGEAAVNGKVLSELITLLPETAWRNEALVEIAAASPALDGASLADLLLLLRTIKDVPCYKNLEKLPKPVWGKIGVKDAQRMIKNWIAFGYRGSAAATLRLWLGAHQDELGEAAAPSKEVADLFRTLAPEIPADDALLHQMVNDAILAIPGAAYAKLESVDVADIVWLARKVDDQHPVQDVVKRVPAQAWARIDRADVERVVKQLVPINYRATATLILELWTAAHAGEWVKPDRDPLGLIGLLPEIGQTSAVTQRTAWALKLPAAAWAGLEPRKVAAFVLSQVDSAKVAELPKEVWRTLQAADMSWYVERAKVEGAAAKAAQLWAGANQDRLGEAGATGKELLDVVVKAFPASGNADGFIGKIPTAAWAKFEQADAFGLIAKASGDLAAKLPKEAWLKVRLRDLERIVETARAHWWRAVQEGTSVSSASGKDLYAMLKVLRPSADRDETIVKIPRAAWARMESPDIAALLGLIGSDAADSDPTSTYEKITEDAWFRIDREDMEALLKMWTDRDKDDAAKAILELWMKAHQ